MKQLSFLPEPGQPALFRLEEYGQQPGLAEAKLDRSDYRKPKVLRTEIMSKQYAQWRAIYSSLWTGRHTRYLHFEQEEECRSYMEWWLSHLGPGCKLIELIRLPERTEA